MRMPIENYGETFKNSTAIRLEVAAIKEGAIKRAGIGPSAIDKAIWLHTSGWARAERGKAG